MASGDEFEGGNLVDEAGQSILRLLQQAADAADQNSGQALDNAQKLSQQLRAAQDHIAPLGADVLAYRDRAERAEAWLNKIRVEIEDQFPTGGPKASR